MLEQGIAEAMEGGDGIFGYVERDGVTLAFSIGNRFLKTAIEEFPQFGYGTDYSSGRRILDGHKANIERKGKQ